MININIRSRLIILFLAIAVIPMFFISFLLFTNVENTFQEQILNEHHFAVKKEVEEINTLIDSYSQQVLLTRDLPPVKGIIRSRRTGIDPVDGSTIEQWRERFQIIFARMIELDRNIDHIRFIDEDGDELVRVNREGDFVKPVFENELQNKAHRDYFQEAIQVERDEVYVSQLNFNIEDGKIEFPYKPIIRFATPVFDENGEIKGLVIINVKANSILEKTKQTTIGNIVMIDQDGYFLINPDKEKEFSLDLGTEYNYFKEQPELIGNTRDNEFKNHHDVEEGEYRIWSKIFYNPNNKGDHWIIFSVIKEDELFFSINKLKNLLTLISIIVLLLVAFLAFFVSKSISDPITKLTGTINDLSKGKFDVQIDPALKANKDEIGILADSFERVIVSLKLAVLRTGMTKEEMGFGKVEALEAKHKAEKELNDILATLDKSSLVAITDKDGTISYANELFVEVSKYPKEELIGQNHRILKSGFHTAGFYKSLWGTLVKGKVWYGLIRNKAKDGSIYWVRSVIAPIFDNDGKINSYAAIRTPITDMMKDIEEQIQKLNREQKIDSKMKQIIDELKTGNYKKFYWGYNYKILRKPVSMSNPKQTPKKQK